MIRPIQVSVAMPIVQLRRFALQNQGVDPSWVQATQYNRHRIIKKAFVLSHCNYTLAYQVPSCSQWSLMCKAEKKLRKNRTSRFSMIFSLPGGWFDTSWKPSKTYTSSPHPQEITRAWSCKGAFFFTKIAAFFGICSSQKWISSFEWKHVNSHGNLENFCDHFDVSWKFPWEFPDVSNFAVNFEPPKLRIEWRSFSTWVANIPGNEGAGPRRLWLNGGGRFRLFGLFDFQVKFTKMMDDPVILPWLLKQESIKTLLSVPSCYHSSGPE